MGVIILGAPGSGKGTQSQLIAQRLGLMHLSTGDLLRAEIAADTPLGRKVSLFLKEGRLVPNQPIIELIKHQIAALKTTAFLLDGFPRTWEQAQALEASDILITAVIYIEIPEEVLIHRLSGRRVHLASGRVYHIDHHPGLVDDQTLEPLVQRSDDVPEVIRHRLKIYNEMTEPLIAWYKQKPLKFCCVSGVGSPEAIYEHIAFALQGCTF